MIDQPPSRPLRRAGENRTDEAAMNAENEEWLRRGWERSDSMLRRVYNEFGPGGNGKTWRKLPTRVYAKMTRKQVDEKYDFPHRHLMHRVAKVLEAE